MAVINTQFTTMTFNSQLVGGIDSITGVDSGESSQKDKTTLASTRKEYEPGLADSGIMEVSVYTDLSDVGQAALATARSDSATEEVVITYNTSPATTDTFQASVLSFSKDLAKDGFVMSKIKLRITGDITSA